MIENSGPPIAPTYLRAERNFIDHYFRSVYNKIEADALLFNRKLPHPGLVGAENELALASLIRDFLPSQFGVEVSAILIDRHGGESRQCDIVIYDKSTFPKYLRKVFPIELVYAVIEVKTNLTSSEATACQQNLESVFALDFRPMLSNSWLTRSEEQKILAQPPLGAVFAFRSDAVAYETFARWFPLDLVFLGQRLYNTKRGPEIRSVLIGCLDKGIIRMESTNLYVDRTLAVAEQDVSDRSFPVTFDGRQLLIDPVKSLFLFLNMLWYHVFEHRIHPGFDVRSYLTRGMSSIVRTGSTEKAPVDWYMTPGLNGSVAAGPVQDKLP